MDQGKVDIELFDPLTGKKSIHQFRTHTFAVSLQE
jgi:hypothetical protein